jgi:ABC-2 type transport system ATP-binding protein
MPLTQERNKPLFDPEKIEATRSSALATPVIELHHLGYSYATGSAALEDVSLEVGFGEIFGLLGPNGGGKTTLFRILATLIKPSSGSAAVLGYNPAYSASLIRRSIGVVFQSQSLDKKLTVSENLTHQGHLYGMYGRELRQRIGHLLEQFGLKERTQARVETLSGGLKRRVELAKAFLHQPRLLLLDEPCTSLDPAARLDFWEYLVRLNREQGVSILLTTHFMDEAEKCDRLAILEKGRLVALDTPDRLKSRVGGDVIVLRTRYALTLQSEIESRFHETATVLEDTVRIERPNGHEFIARLVEAFPGKIEAITFSKPTLEDVFIHETGHRFGSGEKGL